MSLAVKRAYVCAALLALAIVAWYAVLYSADRASGLSGRTDERVERTERFGSDAYDTFHSQAEPGHALALDAFGHEIARASWDVDTYEFRHLLRHVRACTLDLYVNGMDVSGSPKGGFISVDLNGRTLRKTTFSSRSAAYFPVTADAVPDGFGIRDLALSPLDHAYVLTVPVPTSHCLDRRWHVTVRLKKAHWRIESTGIIARFSPPVEALFGSRYVDGAIAAAEIAALFAATLLLLASLFARARPWWYVVPAVAAFALAPLAHDQWDFSVWLRFVDLVAIAHANPAGMWQGTPLWALAPASLAPILTTSGAFFGNASQDGIAVILKGTMALSLVFTAARLSDFAPTNLKRTTFLIAILSPIALYQLAGGYREVLAGALLVEGIHRCYGRRLWTATAFFVGAASITETLAPFLILAAVFAAFDRGRSVRGLWKAAVLVVLAFASIVLQWMLLIPHDLAASGISNRLSSYRFGGASWFGALSDQGLLPQWIAEHSVAVGFASFAALALWPSLVLLRSLRASIPGAIARERAMRATVCLTLAIFLSYRGIDPNTWYALFVSVTAYFARYRPRSPFPFWLGFVQGTAFYAILGLGDFVNWTFLYPHDRGLLGILGRPLDAAVLSANALIAACYVSFVSDRPALLVGRQSRAYVVLFIAALANASIFSYPEDIVFALAVLTLVCITFWRLTAVDAVGRPGRYGTFLALSACVAFGAYAGAPNPAARFALAIGLLLAVPNGLSLVDAVCVMGAEELLSLQAGFGWVSIAGWIALSLACVKGLRDVIRALPSRDAVVAYLPSRPHDRTTSRRWPDERRDDRDLRDHGADFGERDDHRAVLEHDDPFGRRRGFE